MVGKKICLCLNAISLSSHLSQLLTIVRGWGVGGDKHILCMEVFSMGLPISRWGMKVYQKLQLISRGENCSFREWQGPSLPQILPSSDSTSKSLGISPLGFGNPGRPREESEPTILFTATVLPVHITPPHKAAVL